MVFCSFWLKLAFSRATTFIQLTFLGTNFCSVFRCSLCKSSKHWAAKWRLFRSVIGRSSFWLIDTATGFGLMRTFGNKLVIDRWCNGSKSVNHISCQSWNVSQHLYSVEIFLVSTAKSECVVKYVVFFPGGRKKLLLRFLRRSQRRQRNASFDANTEHFRSTIFPFHLQLEILCSKLELNLIDSFLWALHKRYERNLLYHLLVYGCGPRLFWSVSCHRQIWSSLFSPFFCPIRSRLL